MEFLSSVRRSNFVLVRRSPIDMRLVCGIGIIYSIEHRATVKDMVI
jgi:hypothetical protein